MPATRIRQTLGEGFQEVHLPGGLRSWTFANQDVVFLAASSTGPQAVSVKGRRLSSGSDSLVVAGMTEEAAREALASLGEPERLPENGSGFAGAAGLPESVTGFDGELDYRNGLELAIEAGKVVRISLVKPGLFAPGMKETSVPARGLRE